MTTYQRLKAENKELKRKLRVLILEPESNEASVIKVAVMLSEQIDKAVMFGDATINNTTTNGILQQVTN